MSKKTGPIITQTEILSRAIASIEVEIRTAEEAAAATGNTPACQQMLQVYLGERIPKLEALKQMYRYETGAEY